MSLAQPTAPRRLTFDEYIAWARGRPAGRFELVRGEIVEMPAEGGTQNAVKFECAIALREAVASAGLACHVFTDGMTVRINDNQSREPDAAVTAGPVADFSSTDMVDPLILVEVTSPSSVARDSADKLIDYFSLASVRHYLIVNPDARAIVHHRRDADGDILTRIVLTGTIVLEPPGITISSDRILGAAK